MTKEGSREVERKIITPNIQKTSNKMVIVKPCITIITLNVSPLNSPVERHRVAEQIENMIQQYVAKKRGSL